MTSIQLAEQSLRLARVSEQTTQQHRRNAWAALAAAVESEPTEQGKSECFERFLRQFSNFGEVPQ